MIPQGKSSAELVQNYLTTGSASGTPGGAAPEGGDEETAWADDTGSSMDLNGQSNEDVVGLNDISENETQEIQASGKNGQAADKSKPESNSKAAPEKGKIPLGKSGKYLEVDYSNKERINQAFLMEHGARKWQAERDQVKKERDELSGKYTELNEFWTTLEKAYREQGEEGVIDAIHGRQGAAKEFIESRIKRAEVLRNASPEERALLESREQAAKRDRELERIRKENDDFKATVEQEREQARLSAVESRINPAYEKYSFSGKLGDENDEHIFNDMLWNTSLRKLQPYEDQGLDITPAMAEKAFAETARALRKRITGYGEQVAAKTVERKKERSASAVQNKVASGYRGEQGDKEKAMDLLKQGDITSLFQGARTFGKIFRK